MGLEQKEKIRIAVNMYYRIQQLESSIERIKNNLVQSLKYFDDPMLCLYAEETSQKQKVVGQ